VSIVHKRIVVAVSVVLFALMAVAVGIVADVHDLSYPQQLGTKSAASLDFSASGMSDQDAFRQLGMLSDRMGLGLVKVAPDLSGDQSGQIFVVLGTQNPFPSTIRHFGAEPDAQIKGAATLEHSYASGQYLVTGATTHLAEFQSWLTTRRIGNEWTDDNLGATLTFLVRQGSFRTSLLAAVALMVSLVLYWLSVKAKSRALRVLAGVPTWRVQCEDLGGFLMTMTAGAVLCTVVAVSYVGFAHGWIFVPYYASTLLAFDAIVTCATMLCAVTMSAVSWPSAKTLASREPAVRSLRSISIVLKATTFALILATVAPAFAACADSRESAVQLAQWNSLADQAAISFPAAIGESGFQEIVGKVGDIVRDAEGCNAVALSYTWTGDDAKDADFGPYRYMSLVNQRWLDLMLNEGGDGQRELALSPLPLDQVPHGAEQYLGPNMELWSRDHLTAAEALAKVSFYRYSGAMKIPMSLAGSGDLVFPDDAIVVVVPRLHDMFNDSFLASLASSKNLVFTGVGPTLALITRHGLQHKLQVKNVAEEGVLRAQFAAYFAWLQGFALVALIVALLVSAVVGAFITAVLKAQRDFPLRLAGKRWLEILAERVAGEWVVGVALTVLVILTRGFEGGALVTVVAVAGLLMSPLAHFMAARWAFENVSRRRL
jgi:hypothetical protein